MIKTPSFELAVYERGSKSADKLALVLPGLLDTKDYPHMRSHTDFLASQGYYAVSFDPPGIWESPGDISEYTMTNYLTAINELIEHFGNKPTLLVGHSRGGSMAMLGGMTNPKVTNFVAIMSNPLGSAAYRPDPGQDKISSRDLPDNPEQNRQFVLPYSYFQDSDKYNMLDGLKTCTKPKLFILGTKDITVNPRVVIEAFEAAEEPKELREVECDHDYRKRLEIIEKVNRHLAEFLNKYQ